MNASYAYSLWTMESLSLDLKQLSYFISVSDARSFSRAATRLRLTQPALSRRIKELESEMGVALLERHGRGVSLTEAGHHLLERASGLLRLASSIKEEVVARASEPAGSLVVAMPAAFRSMVTSELVGHFKATHPQVKLGVLELTSAGRQEAVLTGKADMAVITSVDPEEGLVLHPLINESLFLVGARERALDTGKAVTLSYLKGLPLIQNSKPNGLRLILEKALVLQGLSADTRIEVDTLGVMIDLVAAGPYFTVLPYSAIHNEVRSGRVTAAPIKGAAITWQVVSATGRPQTAASRLFEGQLRSRSVQLVRTGTWKTGKALR